MPRPTSEALAFARQNAAKAGLHPVTIVKRLRMGWTRAEAIGSKPRPTVKPGPKTQHSLSSDYAKRYHASRRAIAKANGICVDCNTDKAEKSMTKCPGCRHIDRLRHQESKAA